MATTAVNTDHVKHPALDYGTVLEISEPILLRDVSNYHVDASGATIIWTGAPGVWPVRLQSARRCSVRNLTVRSSTKSNAAVLITNETGLLGSTNCVLDNVSADDGPGDYEGFTYGFRIDSTVIGGSDVNNDLHHLVRCEAKKYSHAAVYVSGTQVHNLVMTQLNCADYGNRFPYGIHLVNSGYVSLRDCNLSSHSVDIYSEGPETRIDVNGFNGEHSRKFLRTARVGAEAYYHVQGVRWEGDPVTEDPYVVDFFGPGPATFDTGYFDGLNGVGPKMMFSNYGDANGTIKGSVKIHSWHLGAHRETVDKTPGSDVSIPRRWDTDLFGMAHITKRSVGGWVRRNVKIGRTA